MTATENRMRHTVVTDYDMRSTPNGVECRVTVARDWRFLGQPTVNDLPPDIRQALYEWTRPVDPTT